MMPRSTTMTAEGRRLRRILTWVVVAVVAGNLVVAVLGPLFRGERVTGPSGSSYVTTALGTAAFAELLQEEGFDVDRLRAPATPARLDPRLALVLVEVGFSRVAGPELAALQAFLDSGGRLVLAGPDPAGLIEALDPTGVAPSWSFDGVSEAEATLPGVGRVPLSGRGVLDRWDGDEPFLVGPGGEVVGVAWTVGLGTVAWVADPEPFLNRGLAHGDSAALAVSLVANRPVLFDEYRHGFGGDSFLDLLPDGWPTTLVMLGFAALAWMVAYGRRLGPPEEVERRLRPERAAYVDSVAAILGRAGDLDRAVSPTEGRARKLLAARAGLGPEARDEELRTAAHEAGLPEDDIEAWLGEGDPFAAGRVLARLSDREMR